MISEKNHIVDQIRQLINDLRRDGRGWILLTVSAGWFLSLGVRVIYPAIVPFLRSEFGISLTMAGFLLTVLWGAYALGQFPGGVLGDRYGEGNMLVVSTVISGIAILLVALSFSIEMLFLASIVFGFSTALFGPIRFTIFTDVYTDRTSTAVGITMSSGNIGNSVLPVIAVTLAGLSTWRLGFGLTAPAFFAVGLALYLTVPARTSGASALIDDLSGRAFKQILRGIRQRDIIVLTVVQIFLGFTYQGFVGFFPTYLIEIKGLSPPVAATVFGIFFASAIIVQPLTGYFQDVIGPKIVLGSAIGLFAISLLALPFVFGAFLLAGLTVGLSSRTGTGVVINTYIAGALPSNMKGTGLGLLRMTWILIGTTAPVAIGALGDRGLLEEGFMLLAGFAIVALVMVYFVPLPE